MADTPTTRKRLRKQSLGSNTNTWGDAKLNEVLDVVDQCMDGYVSIALTGNLDLTATTTNYTAADNSKYRSINFTGSMTSAPTVTFPSVQCWYLLFNNTNQTLTALCSGGTGVAIPAGYNALVYGDAIDLRNAAPNLHSGALTVSGQIHGVATGRADTDAVNVLQLATAIASAGLPASAGTLLVDVNDTAAGYIGGKLAFIGTGCSVSGAILNPGGNETLQVTVTVTPQDEGQTALASTLFGV